MKLGWRILDSIFIPNLHSDQHGWFIFWGRWTLSRERGRRLLRRGVRGGDGTFIFWGRWTFGRDSGYSGDDRTVFDLVDEWLQRGGR